MAEAKQIACRGMCASAARPRGKPSQLFFSDNLKEIWELYRKYVQKGVALSADMKSNIHMRMKNVYEKMQQKKAQSFPSSSRAPSNPEGWTSNGIKYEELMAVESSEELEELMQKHKSKLKTLPQNGRAWAA